MKPSSSQKSNPIDRAKYPILLAPFHGARIPFVVRELTQVQILACGDFSLIETMQDKILNKTGHPKMKEIVASAEMRHNIVKAALISPTYDEIIAAAGNDWQVEAKKKELDAIKTQLRGLPRGPQRASLEEEVDALRIWVDLILPEDFLNFVVAYVLGIDKTDIKLVNEEMLLKAAILAERGHDNPSDHLDGTFSPFNHWDIDIRAPLILQEKRENQRAG